MKIYKLDFEKFFEGISKFPGLEPPKELLPEEKRCREILDHIQNPDVKVASDIDWGSFTLDELYKTFDYVDELSGRRSEMHSLMCGIDGFTRAHKKSAKVVDIF